MSFKIDIQNGYYPIVYVRGFAPTANQREEAFYDAYYGYSATSVEMQNVSKESSYFAPYIFEGQLIRFLKEYNYVDAANSGLNLAAKKIDGTPINPTRSIWISRFYDEDVIGNKVRDITLHAEELYKLIDIKIRNELKSLGADFGPNDEEYKVIIIAHSMGGLVTRCMIQNIMPIKKKIEAKQLIHRLVTIGTPHGGIELSAVPDFLEDLLIAKGNVINGAIFKEERMRQYLNLTKNGTQKNIPDLKSLNGTYPEGRCLCIIGSDYKSYNLVKKATGNHSDGLVKQSNAYIKGAYWTNVHRAHSGRRGIVNSFETYENVRRFLFGDTKVQIWLENVKIECPTPERNIDEFFDVEFSLAIRGTKVLLHQICQNPCENAKRFDRKALSNDRIHLHTGFLDTKLRSVDDDFLRFLLTFTIVQRQVKNNLFFDTEFPERIIYCESLDTRINLKNLDQPDERSVHFRWLSDIGNEREERTWVAPEIKDNIIRFPFRAANSMSATVCMISQIWNNEVADESGADVSTRLPL